MKCIHCGANTNHKTRLAKGGCGHCGRRFAFEPRNDSLRVTDARFQGAIQGLSGESKLFFTERQLWYEFNRHLARRRQWWRVPVILALASVVVSISASNLTLLLVGGTLALVAAIALYVRHRQALRTLTVTQEVFRSRYLGAWNRAHGPIEKLLPPLTGQSHLPLQAKEPDLTAYSFNRVLVTGQSEIAAMLVANHFHTDNNCAILSIEGYPSGLTDTILTMLRRNPQLTVYALHDASIEGCRMPLRLRQTDWFPDSTIAIFDLGLRPRQIEALKLPVITSLTQTIPAEVRQLLTPKEIAWLEQGSVIELAAVRPAQLVRAVSQGLSRGGTLHAKKQTEEAGDGGDGGEVIWIHSTDDGDADGDGEGDAGGDADGFG